MTPDDMEAVVERIQQDMDDVADLWRHCRIAFVNAADPDDVVGFPSFTKADLRALLLDYQERGRALERIAATPLLNDGGAQRRLGQVVTEARATLKGKSQ
jgi:hypothetical protein